MTSIATRIRPVKRLFTPAVLARHASSSASPASSSSPQSSSPNSIDHDSKTHYLVTLLRSPLHLPKHLKASCNSLGLNTRLSSSIVPITPENAGYILSIKELVGVRTVGVEDVLQASDPSWRNRPGEGRQGRGLSTNGVPGSGVVRVGSERARGDERGFKVISR
ncbi:hypothetical protein T439DRAFT_324674 [Meredithblackwellia eburnea MCA 4105]